MQGWAIKIRPLRGSTEHTRNAPNFSLTSSSFRSSTRCARTPALPIWCGGSACRHDPGYGLAPRALRDSLTAHHIDAGTVLATFAALIPLARPSCTDLCRIAAAGRQSRPWREGCISIGSEAEGRLGPDRLREVLVRRPALSRSLGASPAPSRAGAPRFAAAFFDLPNHRPRVGLRSAIAWDPEPRS